jgi:predicted metal-dependent hydrolase
LENSKIEHQKIEHLKLEINQTSKAKRLILRVLPEGVLRVTAPKRVRKSEIDDLIRKNSDWIQKKWLMLSQLPKPAEIQFIHLEKIPFQGQLLTLEIIDGKGPVHLLQNTLVVPVPLKITTSLGEERAKEFIRKSVLKWYKLQALQRIHNKVSEYTEKIGSTAKSIALKNYTARWGACSSKGDLIFNWQIVAFEPLILEYVVAHEVCHLKEMNHSVRFYEWLNRLGYDRSFMRHKMKNLKNPF